MLLCSVEFWHARTRWFVQRWIRPRHVPEQQSGVSYRHLDIADAQPSHHRLHGPTIKSVHLPLTWHPSLTSSGPQQAVIASGLGALYVADHYNTTYLHQAQVSLDATIHSSLTYDDVLKESCDDVQLGGSVCDKDQVRDLIRWPTRPVVVMLTPSPSPHRECSR